MSGPLAETNKKNTVDLVRRPSPLLRFSLPAPPCSCSLPSLLLTPARLPAPGEHPPPTLLQRR